MYNEDYYIDQIHVRLMASPSSSIHFILLGSFPFPVISWPLRKQVIDC